MQKGIGRGIFSNEAGLGSAPILAAAAKTKDTVRQGLVTMTGTFIDTIVICTLTGLSIVVTGAQNAFCGRFRRGRKDYQPCLADGSALERSVLCLRADVVPGVLCLYHHFGLELLLRARLEYLVGSQKFTKVYRYLYILAVFIGPYLTVAAVWNIADICNGLMAFPNLIALFALSGVVGKETRAYFCRKTPRLKSHGAG